MIMVVNRAPILIILCYTLNLTLIEGLYILQVQLLDYNNPTQQAVVSGQFACCDGCIGTFRRRCDTFFIFCLRPLDTTGLGCGSSSGSEIQSGVNVNDADIDYSGSTVLGLNNPLNLPGLTNDWNGIQLYIEVRDWDSENTSQLIAAFILTVTLPLNVPSGNRMFVRTLATINVNIRVLCAQNFQGSDCTQCIPGFTGAMCDEIDDCLGETCPGNRQCVDGVDTFTCECNPGFTGSECMENINECIGVNCSGNGQCVDEIDSYSCNCSAGYNGTDCDIDIDDCSPDPCDENGQCMDGIDSFTCNCATGYTGTLCDSDIDECLSNPCGMNRQCENQEGSFNCNCNPGFTGDLCQIDIDDCVGVNCSGNTVCVDGVNSFMCQEIVQDSNVQAGPIIGGVLGGLISLILILIIVVVAVILTVRCLNIRGKEHIQDTLPGDNPVYDKGNTSVMFGGLTQASAPVRYTNLSSSDRDNTNMAAGSAPDWIFDNPIYGGNGKEVEDTYADPDANHHTGTGMGSSPYHKFDNPIYGGEEDENSTYALLADSSTENAYSSVADSSTGNDGTAAASGQAAYANAKRGRHAIGNEQVYDHIN